MQPPNVTLTGEEAAYFQEACEAWQSLGEPENWVVEDIEKEFPGLSQADACEWAVMGYTVQGEITWEEILNIIITWAEKAAETNEANIRELINRYEVVKQGNKALEESNASPGFFKKLFD